jgi:hypothetical protein
LVVPDPAGAHPSPLDSLTLDFIVDQSGLVVIDGAANRATYDPDAPSAAERSVIVDQVVEALGIPRDSVQVDAAKSDLYHEVGFRVSLHQPFTNDADSGVRIDTSPLQTIAASLGTLTFEVCRTSQFGLTLATDATAPASAPDPQGAGNAVDRADCHTWVLRADDPAVVVTARVTSSGAPDRAVRGNVVLPCGSPSTGDPSFVVGDAITYPSHTLQAHATGAPGAPAAHLLEADTVIGFTTRSRVELVVPKAQVGHISFGTRDGPRATRRLTVPECKYAQARPWTLSGIRIWVDVAACVPVTVTTPRSKQTVRIPVGAPC